MQVVEVIVSFPWGARAPKDKVNLIVWNRWLAFS